MATILNSTVLTSVCFCGYKLETEFDSLVWIPYMFVKFISFPLKKTSLGNIRRKSRRSPVDTLKQAAGIFMNKNSLFCYRKKLPFLGENFKVLPNQKCYLNNKNLYKEYFIFHTKYGMHSFLSFFSRRDGQSWLETFTKVSLNSSAYTTPSAAIEQQQWSFRLVEMPVGPQP